MFAWKVVREFGGERTIILGSIEHIIERDGECARVRDFETHARHVQTYTSLRRRARHAQLYVPGVTTWDTTGRGIYVWMTYAAASRHLRSLVNGDAQRAKLSR